MLGITASPLVASFAQLDVVRLGRSKPLKLLDVLILSVLSMFCVLRPRLRT